MTREAHNTKLALLRGSSVVISDVVELAQRLNALSAQFQRHYQRTSASRERVALSSRSLC